MASFDSLSIRPDLLQNVQFLGFAKMTPIQEMALPLILAGKDVIGQAKTGTGKTLAFAIPVTQRIKPEKKAVQAIILTPTRELAVQVGSEFEKVAGSAVKATLCYGGASINPQIESIKKGSPVVVGTPGRVIDLIKRRVLDLSSAEVVVLDEADRMLDMGFIDDVEWIIKKTPNSRQTLLFSATMPEEIKKLSQRYMRDPELVSANADEDELTVNDIDQFYISVDQKKKLDAFFKLLKEENPEKVLVFGKTKYWVEKLYGIMRKKKFSVARIHGDMSQAARERAIDKLRDGSVSYVVATDVAARGLDIDDITHVINYDLPQEPLTYVHRIGRTARAGKKGKAFTFLNPSQQRDLWLIEHKARTSIPEREIKV